MKVFRLVACLGLIACSNESSPVGVPSNSVAPSLTATVGDSPFAAAVAVRAIRTDNTLTIQGSDSSGRGITLEIVQLTGPGDYDIGYGSLNVGQYRELQNAYVSNYGVKGWGTIHLQTLNANRVIGTFRFQGIGNDRLAFGLERVVTGKFDFPL